MGAKSKNEIAPVAPIRLLFVAAQTAMDALLQFQLAPYVGLPDRQKSAAWGAEGEVGQPRASAPDCLLTSWRSRLMVDREQRVAAMTLFQLFPSRIICMISAFRLASSGIPL